MDTPAASVPFGFTIAEMTGRRVVVFGARVAGASAARFLLSLGARVNLVDDSEAARAAVAAEGFSARTTAELTDDPRWPTGVDLVVTSPGLRPDHPQLMQAAAVGVPVWGDVELAWQADRSGALGAPRTWLVVTGTNGKTTTTSMTEAILTAAGIEALACGNIGLPSLDALIRTPRVEVLVVEASSFQLYWAPSLRPDAGVVLNIAEDHLDWHGGMENYARAKARALTGSVAVIGAGAAEVEALTPGLGAGIRLVRLRLESPREGEIGVVDGHMVDRAFDAGSGAPLVAVDRVRPAGRPGLCDALAAAALSRAAGVAPDAVEAGLSGFVPGAHRGQLVARVDGVEFVDDSKATNPHAALASLTAFSRVVLVAGGQLKGASVDEFVVAVRSRLAGVVLIGLDRHVIAQSIARHAPEVPTVTVFTGDDGRVSAELLSSHLADSGSEVSSLGVVARDAALSCAGASSATAREVMTAAVSAAAAIARRDGQIRRAAPPAVLLAPAAASLDMFAGYGERGDIFAAAANALSIADPRT